MTLQQERAYLETVSRHPKSVFYCAFQGEELVGTGSLSGLTRRAAHRAEVALCVTKAHWNAGIGTRLLAALLAYAQAHGLEMLNLEVRRDNAPAIHLYEKFGFRPIGVSPAFFKIGEERVDYLLMYRDLSQ